MLDIKKLDFKLATGILMILLGGILLLHLMVLLGIIPYSLVWGGRLQTDSQMYAFEAVSITINLLAIAVVAMKGGHIPFFLPKGIVSFLVWGLMVLFALNTVGNLFAQHWIEKFVFTPLTLIVAVLFYRITIDSQVKEDQSNR